MDIRAQVIATARKKLLEFFQNTQGEKDLMWADFAREVRAASSPLLPGHKFVNEWGVVDVYDQKDLEKDNATIDEALARIRKFIFTTEVLSSYQVLSLASPGPYTCRSDTPQGPRTDGEWGSELATAPSTKGGGLEGLIPGGVTWKPGRHRKLPINAGLMSILEKSAAELDASKDWGKRGFSIQVFSPGQPSMAEEGGKRETANRTGSARHDHGFAADIYCCKDGRRLSAWIDTDLPEVITIAKVLLKNGIHSIGAGKKKSGYMNGNMHVDIATGNPDGYGGKIKRCKWGAGGHGWKAPVWLNNIYG